MFYQRAHGSFVAPVVPGTPHCGVNPDECRCDYHIELTFNDESLDTDGFLLDNTVFQGYFVEFSAKPVSISCENLCRQIALDLCALCNDRATHVSVALSPFSGVEVSYTYTPSTDAPIPVLQPVTASVRLLSEVS